MPLPQSDPLRGYSRDYAQVYVADLRDIRAKGGEYMSRIKLVNPTLDYPYLLDNLDTKQMTVTLNRYRYRKAKVMARSVTDISGFTSAAKSLTDGFALSVLEAVDADTKYLDITDEISAMIAANVRSDLTCDNLADAVTEYVTPSDVSSSNRTLGLLLQNLNLGVRKYSGSHRLGHIAVKPASGDEAPCVVVEWLPIRKRK